MEGQETKLEFGDWSIVIISECGDGAEYRQYTAITEGHMN